MLAGVPEVDDLGLGREALEEGPVVGGGHGTDPDLRAHTPDMGDLPCELRLQRDLAALGHAAQCAAFGSEVASELTLGRMWGNAMQCERMARLFNGLLYAIDSGRGHQQNQ